MRRVVGLLVAVLLGTATGAVVLAGPAAATACAKGTGVTVVVGSNVRCDSGGAGRSAVNNFKDVGHVLQSYQGFICRIDNMPSVNDEPCTKYPPADAYWALFWSNGETGKWVYSQSGASSLTVPAGGWVGFMFHQGSGTVLPPPMKPMMVASSVKPKPHASTAPKGSGTPSTVPSAKATATATATAKKPKPSASDKNPSSSGSPTEDASAAAQSGDDLQNATQTTSGPGSLVWVAAALALLLVAGMGTVIWRRRTAGGRQT